jgi:cytochrome c-type biogenesis protein CcmE
MRKTRRLYFILLVLGCLALAVGLSLYALRDNVSFFYTPHDVKTMQARHDARVAAGRVFRLGGLVKKGSLTQADDKVTIRFTVTDTLADMRVQYTGIPPDLFREGQGVVAKGRLDGKGLFVADELLAKHDEKYMPPELKKSMQKIHDAGVKAAEKRAAP